MSNPETDHTGLNRWRIHRRDASSVLPDVILTPKSRATASNLPPELAGLLPTRREDGAWLSDVAETACVGLFLADPLFQRQRTENLLSATGARWLINLPTVSQYDAEFTAALSEVGLGPRRELDMLADYHSNGYACIAAVAAPADAAYAQSLGLSIIAVLPRVPAYEGGFPSELSRNRAVDDVAEAVGPGATLLSLVTAAEAAAQSVWPPHVTAVIERPS